MNKLLLMRNPDFFQGQKYLKTNKNYFEGWYFKNTNQKESISFIPGVNIDNLNKKAFIQVITNESSYYINYDIEDFGFDFQHWCIKIGNNTFGKDGVHLEIEDIKQNIKIYGNLRYSHQQNINTHLFYPNIMGPFSYIPFMECNHAIINMYNKINGSIKINNQQMDFCNGTGYIEKDWGCSFPKSYIWCQGNCFQEYNASFMLSIAHIPFGFFSFKGLICVLIIDHEEYKFTTYNHTKILKYVINNNIIDIALKKGSYQLNIQSHSNKGLKLVAPKNGKMEKEILESITSLISVTLKKNNHIIFSDTSTNCGLEIV